MSPKGNQNWPITEPAQRSIPSSPLLNPPNPFSVNYVIPIDHYVTIFLSKNRPLENANKTQFKGNWVCSHSGWLIIKLCCDLIMLSNETENKYTKTIVTKIGRCW